MTKSLDEFKDLLIASRLITSAEIEAILRTHVAQSSIDSRGLAIELVRRKKLTPYQTQQIYQGRGKSLSLGNYLVLEKLGQGGMGTVLKSLHRRMDRIVALKIVSSLKNRSDLRRFQREVKVAAKLVHPNIVTAYDADEANGIHFLVMEYVEGTDLAALIRANGPVSVETALSCVLQAARGLEHAHWRRVIHRDVKPSNMLMQYDGVVKVLDVGLARLNSDAAPNDQLTNTGDVIGTVDFMAPEQATDPRNADQRADIYSLGATMWYLMAGRPLFDRETTVGKLLAHQHEPAPSLSTQRNDVPPALDEIFRRMVAKNPNARYQSMPELIEDLSACTQIGAMIQAPAKPSADDMDEWQLSAQMDQPARSSAPTLVAQPAPPPLPSTKLYRTRGLLFSRSHGWMKYGAGLILVFCTAMFWYLNSNHRPATNQNHPGESHDQHPTMSPHVNQGAVVAADAVGPFETHSVWVRNDDLMWSLTVIERNGESFKAIFNLCDKQGHVVHERLVTGTIRNKTVAWFAKDAQAIKGDIGHDNVGTIVSDTDGDRIDFVWTNAKGGSGTYTLYLAKTSRGIVNGDFSSGLYKWEQEGETQHFAVFTFKDTNIKAYTTGPAGKFQYVGRIYQSFVVPKDADKLECYLHGSSSSSTFVALRDQNEVYWRQSGPHQQMPVRYDVDVTQLRGKRVTFEVVDNNRGQYGYIGVHGIRFLPE